jgi:protein tyrosine kinase modulator
MRLRLKDEHPDVIRMRRFIRDLERQADAEALERPLSAATAPVGVSQADRARLHRLNELRLERESARLSIASRETESKRLRSIISQYQARVAAAPTRESELIALTRDYDTLQKGYAALLAKREDAQIAANLERRQIGEQFRILDAARMPEKPSRPNRPLIDAAGAIVALGLGLALAALLEYRDMTLNREGDIALALHLPVLGAIPALLTSGDRARRRQRKLVASVTVTALILATAAAIVVRKLH